VNPLTGHRVVAAASVGCQMMSVGTMTDGDRGTTIDSSGKGAQYAQPSADQFVPRARSKSRREAMMSARTTLAVPPPTTLVVLATEPDQVLAGRAGGSRKQSA
jgi:hypothetical protein